MYSNTLTFIFHVGKRFGYLFYYSFTEVEVLAKQYNLRNDILMDIKWFQITQLIMIFISFIILRGR